MDVDLKSGRVQYREALGDKVTLMAFDTSGNLMEVDGYNMNDNKEDSAKQAKT